MKGIKSSTAFTMIELIFVIIILGILAAVALPKFSSLSQEANEAVCVAAVGTMNRTIGETLWSKSISEGNAGSVTSYANDIVPGYIEWPEKCGGESAIEGVVGGTDTVVTIDGTSYDLTMVDGTSTTSPHFGWSKQ